MRTTIVIGMLLTGLCATGGCSKFSGEWVQDGTIDRAGAFTPVTTDNRLALKFTPPSTVRVGRYLAPVGVVDRQTTTTETYFTMKHRTVAQFNSMSLRVEDGHLVGYVSGDTKLRFKKMKGASIFPPAAVLPSLARTKDASPADSVLAKVSEAVSEGG